MNDPWNVLFKDTGDGVSVNIGSGCCAIILGLFAILCVATGLIFRGS